MGGYDAKNRELREELEEHYPGGAKVCDPFSGRAMIPLEAARLGVQAWGIDYSPVATLAGKLLADYPLRDWTAEPDLPFEGYQRHKAEHFTDPRVLRDVRFVLDLVGETLCRRDGRVLRHRERQAPLGLRVGGDAAMRQLRQSVPAHGQAYPPES